MAVPAKLDPKALKPELADFREKTDAFYAGQMPKPEYKGFSGYFGSYAQRSGEASMLRLRMPAGRVTKQRLAFVAGALRSGVKRLHFTTCQTIQLHDLVPEQLYRLIEGALDVGIIPLGGGGDFPRNVMCSPLAGAAADEYFDVTPWAEAAGDYLLHFLHAEKMPRKLKVGFSSSPANLPHATFRDLGFAARPDGLFDVYSAGGLGGSPKFGVKVAEAVAPDQILYYIKAMWLTFRAYGNYENRAKARTRYMQDALGGPEAYAAAYREKLDEVYRTEDLTLTGVAAPVLTKTGAPDAALAAEPRVTAQKQPGLYAVAWHPVGGMPDPDVFCAVSDALQDIDAAELRLCPDEGAYLVNLTAGEAPPPAGADRKRHRAQRVRDLGRLHRRGHLPGRPARFAGAAGRVRGRGARGRAAGRRAAADPHFRLPVQLRHPPDRGARFPRRGQGGRRQAAARLHAVLRAAATARAVKRWAARWALCCGRRSRNFWSRWAAVWPPPGRTTPPGTPPTPPPSMRWPPNI